MGDFRVESRKLCVARESRRENLEHILELLARSESHGSPGGNLDLFTSAGIPSLSGFSLADVEGAEADELDSALLRLLLDGVERHFHCGLGILLGEVRLLCNFLDELPFVHAITSLLVATKPRWTVPENAPMKQYYHSG